MSAILVVRPGAERGSVEHSRGRHRKNVDESFADGAEEVQYEMWLVTGAALAPGGKDENVARLVHVLALQLTGSMPKLKSVGQAQQEIAAGRTWTRALQTETKSTFGHLNGFFR
ncbi:UNVERIFIED_CONTAM: hypothetical protein PYX00_003823 [Menopon gallinae]|uniref:Uncharacterized protein n=1 Tax=Menopon gallinae TaxID=328185 RepID=A0AAW2I1T4_9NEOP